MRDNLHAQIEVARAAAGGTRHAFAAVADLGAGLYAGRNLDLEAAAVFVDQAGRAAVCFFK